MKLLLAYIFKRKVRIKLSDIKFIPPPNKTMDKILVWDSEQNVMRQDILNGNYVEGYESYPSITKDNVCIDGHHRITALKEIKDPEYKIIVTRWFIKWDDFYKIIQKKIEIPTTEQ